VNIAAHAPDPFRMQAVAERAVSLDVGTRAWAERYSIPAASAQRIPKIIHQIWIGPRPAPHRWMQTWRDAHRGWEYKLWDNEACAKTSFECQYQIDTMPEWNGKADIIRYEILLREGGFCFDADSECVQALDDHFLGHENVACYENETIFPGRVATGYLGAAPGSKLMRAAVDRIADGAVGFDRAWIEVGPIFFTNLVDDLGDEADIHVYPSRVFIPEHWNHDGAGGRVLAPGDAPIYARQYWGSTLGYPDQGRQA
jgi:mannosyltransferase OCH1-like enzyme